jgi:hypothetical protein
MDVREEMLETWRTNNRINLLIIDAISPAAMKATLSRRGGRTVARQFAHLHNWLSGGEMSPGDRR